MKQDGKVGGASWWRVCYQRGLPRLVLLRNRNQRCDLTRLRISTHCLGVERLRYTQPMTAL